MPPKKEPEWPECLHDWQMIRELGRGTAGVVYLVEKDEVRAAAKLQHLSSAKQKDKFTREVKNQIAFHPFAPRVLYHDLEKRDARNWVGVIVMELMEIELDSWLSKKRTVDELQDMTEQVAELGRFCMERRLTHGDLPLFNLARTPAGRWLAIDFDRSSTTVFRPDVDLYRLQMEILSAPKDRSLNTKPLEASNVRWLRKNALVPWEEAWGLRLPEDVSQAWEDAYEEYCRAAKVPCLE